MYDKSLGQALGYGQRFVPGRFGRRVRPVGVDVQTPQQPTFAPGVPPGSPTPSVGKRQRKPVAAQSPLQRAIYPQVM